MALRQRLDTVVEGEAFLRLEGPEAEPRLNLVTSGEALARLLEGAAARFFLHEPLEQPVEERAVERFLRDCAEYSDVDVKGLPEGLREEMEAFFAEQLELLWKLEWWVFGAERAAALEPGPDAVRGRTVTVCLARHGSPSVEMDARLRKWLANFKQALERLRGEDDEGSPPLVH